jgi:hypothetical protein
MKQKTSEPREQRKKEEGDKSYQVGEPFSLEHACPDYVFYYFFS